MSEPFRLRPVVVMLDVYRNALTSAGPTLSAASTHIRGASVRLCHFLARHARRLTRESPETMPSMICDRLKSRRER